MGPLNCCFLSTHIALRVSLTSCQPVNCIFWPIRTLNCVVAASKLHNKTPCCTAEWPIRYTVIVHKELEELNLAQEWVSVLVNVYTT